jgi:hypothetical protein
MIRIILFLTVCFISCGQQRVGIKTKGRDIKPLTDSTVDIFSQKKESLNQLFLLNKDSAKFNSRDLWTSLLIGHLFDKEQKDAVLRYEDNDTVANVIILRLSGKNWDTIFSTKIYPVSTGGFEDLIEVSDFNGDNIPDLKVVKDYWNIHTGEKSDLWLYSKNHFTKVQGFDSIITATYDKRSNLIYAYQSMGCADMVMYFGIFKIIGNKVEKIKEMSCDCCLESNDSCTIKVFGRKPYFVPYKMAYKYVPSFYADGVREKCEMAIGQ